ncbi:MAG: YkgJ family cysteine cluster protein [Promethearchaeota archaeon]
MKEKCKNCGKCCIDTEMMISKKDISLILRQYPQDLREEDFVIKNHGYSQLKNIDGHCVFFDAFTKKCKIYINRPQGCRFYPLTYDKDKKLCVFDEDCPRIELFYLSDDDFEKKCRKIKIFLREDLNIHL